MTTEAMATREGGAAGSGRDRRPGPAVESATDTVELIPDVLHELQVGNLHVCVAVDLIPLIDTMIEDHGGRLVVVADVVDCWLRLPHHVRAAYDREPRYGGLSRFVGDYFDDIEHAWPAGQSPSPDEVSTDEAEECCRRRWRLHERDIRRRLAAGEPPSDEWLHRITSEQLRQ
jgi:hypothetical protein